MKMPHLHKRILLKIRLIYLITLNLEQRRSNWSFQWWFSCKSSLKCALKLCRGRADEATPTWPGDDGSGHLFPLPKHQLRRGFYSFFLRQGSRCVALMFLIQAENTSEDHQGPSQTGPPDAVCGEAEGNALRAASLRNTNRSHQTPFPPQNTPGAQLRIKDQ